MSVSSQQSPANGLKILMLHGFTQSGSLFHAKTRALEKSILKAFPSSSLHYLTGPLSLDPIDKPGFDPSTESQNSFHSEAFAWWRRVDDGTEYRGIDKGLATIASTIKEYGPFDGVMGFSQGAAAAAMVASLLDHGRREAFDQAVSRRSNQFPYPSSFLDVDGKVLQQPLKFAIEFSGFAAPTDLYEGFYVPNIKTPILHFIGSLDTAVEEARTRTLINSCEKGGERIVTHPGGHYVPSQKIWLDTVTGFIKECVAGTHELKSENVDNAEDMDVPF